MNGGGRIKISEMAAGGESEDDVPALSAETFTALQEFYREQVHFGKSRKIWLHWRKSLVRIGCSDRDS